MSGRSRAVKRARAVGIARLGKVSEKTHGEHSPRRASSQMVTEALVREMPTEFVRAKPDASIGAVVKTVAMGRSRGLALSPEYGTVVDQGFGG